MNRLTAQVYAALIALSLSVPVCAATVTLDLDSLSPGTLATNAFAAWGIDSVVSSSGSIPAFIYDANDCPSCGFVTPSGTHNFMVAAGGSYPTPAGTFSTTFLFHDPTPYFSFEKLGYTVGTVGVAGWEASAYDASDTLVDSVGVNLAGGLDYPPSSVPVSYSLSGTNAIVKVVILANYNYQSSTGSLQFGNIQFDQPSVPEPSTLVLSLAGGAIVGWVRMRRRRA